MMMTARRHWSVGLVGAAALTCLGLIFAFSAASAQDPAAPEGGAADVAPAGTTTAPTVKIVFKVVPPNRATVTWGKKKLGLIKPRNPLVVERPRDSGPLDVVVRADGCIPVHTRAYTFTNTTVAVKVTPVDQKNTLFGYREALPPDPDAGTLPISGGPDGGAPPPRP